MYLLLSAAGGKDKDMYFNQVEFGKRIKEERNRLQMTQEDLAQELNIGYVHMNGIENGRKGCSIDLLLEIAEVLDVSTDYLLTGRLSGGTNTAKNKLKEIAARLNDLRRSMLRNGYPSIRMVFFSGSFSCSCFGMESFRTPCSNLAFTSSSFTLSPT